MRNLSCQPNRYDAAGKEFGRAAASFMAIVEIEQDLAHIAAMASMASGNVGARNIAGHLRSELSDELLDELEAGIELDKYGNASRRVRRDEQANFR
jgi:hypothetical protein